MTGQASKKTFKSNAFFTFTMIFISIISMLINSRVGFNTDEQYAFTMMYRFSTGEKYLTDLSDAYQFSALFMTPLYQFCQMFSNPLIVYRMLSVLIYALLAVHIFFLLGKYTSQMKIVSALISLVWLTALPKGVISLEHSNLLKILITYFIVFFIRMMKSDDHGYILGLLFSLICLVYPPMIVAAIPLGVFLLFKRKNRFFLELLGTCILSALIIIVPVIIKNGSDGLIHSIWMILLDGSHAMTINQKASRFVNENVLLAIYIIKLGLCYVTALCLGFLLRRKEIGRNSIIYIPFVLIVFQSFVQVLFPLYDYTRYMLFLGACLFFGFKNKDDYLFASSLLLLTVWIITFTATNQGFIACSGYVMGSVLLFAMFVLKENRMKQLFLTVVLISQCIMLTMTFNMTSSTPNTLFDFQFFKNSNYLNGSYVEKNTDILLSEADNIQPMLASENLIVCGRDVYLYNVLGKKVFAPVTNGTPSYNAQWMEYISEHLPESINVILENDDINGAPLLKILEKWYKVTEIIDGSVYYDIYYLSRK